MHKRRNVALHPGNLDELTDVPRQISNTYDNAMMPQGSDLSMSNIRQGRSSHHSNPNAMKPRHDELMAMASGPPPAVLYSRTEQTGASAAGNESHHAYPQPPSSNFFDEFLQGANNGSTTGTGLRNRPGQFSSIGG